MARYSFATRTKRQIAACALAMNLLHFTLARVMVPTSLSIRTRKIKVAAWALAKWSLPVVAVALVGLVPGVSNLGALLIVAGSLLLWRVRGVLSPAHRHRHQRGQASPGGTAGDRFPRRPFPFQPAGSMALPLQRS